MKILHIAFGGLGGLIITYGNLRYLQQRSAVLKSLKRRIKRIFPVYWIVITGFLALQLLFPSFYNTHFDTRFANVLQTYLLLPGHIMVNGVSWSLTNELFFYLLFTLAILIPHKKITFWLMPFYFILLVVCTIINPGFINSNLFTQTVLPSMHIEFLPGVFIVLLVNHLTQKMAYPVLITGILPFFTF